MQSKKSFFNRYLFFKTIKRFWPLWVIVSIGACITSVITVEGSFNYMRHSVNFSKYIFANDITSVFPVVSLLYSIVVAMCVWGYLYNKSGNYHYHALPITRDGLFVTHYLAGIVITWFPFLVGILVQIGILAGTSVISWEYLFYVLATSVVESIFFFTIATLTAFVTANNIALPVLYFVFNFLEFIIRGVTLILAKNFYPGIGSYDNDKLAFLSPFVWINGHILSKCEIEYNEGGFYGYSVKYQELMGIGYLWLLLAGAVVMALLSQWAYKTSCNENVGKAISIKWLRPVLLVIFTYTSAVCFSEAVWLVGTDYSGRNYYSIPVMALLMVIGAAITFFVGLMILNKTTGVFNKKTVGAFSAIAVLLVFMCMFLGNDWLRIARSIPAKNDIEGVYVYTSGHADYFDAEKESGLVDRVYELNKAYINDSDYIKNVSGHRFESENVEYTYADINIVYALKNGRTVSKHYNSVILKNRSEETGTYDNLYREFISNKDITRRNILPGEHRRVSDVRLYVNYNDEFNEVYVQNEDLDGLFEAISKDIDEGLAFGDDLFPAKHFYDVSIEINYDCDRDYIKELAKGATEYYSYNDDYVYTELTDEMTNTVNYLIDKGYLDSFVLESMMHEMGKYIYY